jgi:glutamate dehydrogenase (NAD(P)+)
MMDERAKWLRFEPDAFSGKPPLWGGRAIREEATGQGGSLAADVAAARFGIQLRGARAAVIGYGAAGAPAARYLAAQGPRIVAVTSDRGAVVGRHLDVHELEQWVRINGKELTAFQGGDAMPPDEAFDKVASMDVDVLVLAERSGMVNAEVARHVRARMVVEIVPAAVTPDGEAVLTERGTIVVPELIAGALGAYASGLELQGFDPEHIRRRLENRAREINHAVHQLAGEAGLTLRNAGWQIAVERFLRHARDVGVV